MVIRAQSRLAAQSRLGHSSVMARSQLNHGEVTARSQLGVSIFSMITAQSRLGHSSITAQVTAQSRLAVTILVTVANCFLMGSQSQARQVCSAGLSIANLRQAVRDFNKGNALKSCCQTRSDGWTLCMHMGNSDSRYLPEGSDKGTNSENVHWSRGYQLWLVLSRVCRSYFHSSLCTRWAVN